MTLALEIAGPILLLGLVIGLLVSIFQAVTSIQEQSLSFIPKIVGVAVLIVVLGPWMLGQLVTYAQNLYTVDPVADRMSTLTLSTCSRRSAAASRSPGSSSCWPGSRPLFVLAPLFSSKMIPSRSRESSRSASAIGLTGIAMHGQHIPTDPLPVAGLIVVHLLVGLLLAFTVGALFAAVQTAGGLADIVSGFSFGATVDPINGNQGGTFSELYATGRRDAVPRDRRRRLDPARPRAHVRRWCR